MGLPVEKNLSQPDHQISDEDTKLIVTTQVKNQIYRIYLFIYCCPTILFVLSTLWPMWSNLYVIANDKYMKL